MYHIKGVLVVPTFSDNNNLADVSTRCSSHPQSNVKCVRQQWRMKEHRDACERGTLEMSAVAEHTWERHQPIKWEDTTILSQTRGHKELKLQEAFHIQRIPAGDCLNHALGLELPNCWGATLRRLQNKKKQQWTRPSLIRSRVIDTSMRCQAPITVALSCRL